MREVGASGWLPAQEVSCEIVASAGPEIAWNIGALPRAPLDDKDAILKCRQRQTLFPDSLLSGYGGQVLKSGLKIGAPAAILGHADFR